MCIWVKQSCLMSIKIASFLLILQAVKYHFLLDSSMLFLHEMCLGYSLIELTINKNKNNKLLKFYKNFYLSSFLFLFLKISKTITRNLSLCLVICSIGCSFQVGWNLGVLNIPLNVTKFLVFCSPVFI